MQTYQLLAETPINRNMMDFPGRIYLRAEDDIHSAEHQTMLKKWIVEFERLSRQSFIFPVRHIRTFGYLFVVIGLLLMIIQVPIYFFYCLVLINVCFLTIFRLRCRLFKMFTFQVFSVQEFGLDCWVWRVELLESMLPNRRAVDSKLVLYWMSGNLMAPSCVGYYLNSLLDFMVMTTVLNIFSAMVVILNTIGLEMYSRFCASGKANEWIGECGNSLLIEMNEHR